MEKIDVSKVKELRERTCAGMADCKLALEEVGGSDIEKAIDLIKARGLNNTSKFENKTAAEGRIVCTGNNRCQTLVEINAQTDFTSGSPAFIKFAETAGSILGKTDLNSFSGNLGILSVDEKTSLEDARKELMASSKENIVVRRWLREEVFSDSARVFSYLHPNAKLASLVSIDAGSAEAAAHPDFIEFGSNIAMQIAAMSPLAISSDKIDAADKSRQIAIFEKQLDEEKKPADKKEQILIGKMKKWFKENALLSMQSILDDKKSIETLIYELSLKLHGKGEGVKILSLLRAAVGETVPQEEKTDYGEEISKMTGIEAETSSILETPSIVMNALTNNVDIVKSVN